MKKNFEYMESRGLPGGPNEIFTYVTGVFSTEGYKANSPDVNNPFNIIPSGNITMEGVNFPVKGTDNLGNTKVMMPGNNYKFPGDMVFEVPMAQRGKEVRVDYGDGNIKKLSTDSAEYRKLYNEGRIGVRNYDDSISMGSLPEVTVTADKQTGKNILEDYPYYNQLTEEEKKYFRDSGPIGRQIRSKATNGVGVTADGVKDFAMAWLRDLPLASLQAPQSALVEGVEGLRGNEFNMLNAFIPGKQRIPSDVWGFETTNDMSWYNPRVVGNFLMDMVADPLNVVGAGIADDILKLGLKQGLKNTAVRNIDNIKQNAWKLNPGAYQYNLPENTMWRGIGEEGMQDALESGLFRAKPADKIPARTVDLGSLGKLDMAKRFDKTYYSPRFSIADRYGAGYIAEVPKDAAKFGRRYKGSDWSMATKEQIPISKGRLLEKNWWSGYKPIEVPKTTESFKSEIDWAKWNKEIPENKALMQEYNAIEQQAKADGTWMKNPDGSAFKGTPEQFVQQNSENFKKAFPNPILDNSGNIQINYHGSPNKFEEFKPALKSTDKTGERLGKGIYTTPKRSKALEYAIKNQNKKGNLYELYQNANNKQTAIQDIDNYISNKIEKIKSDFLNKKISNEKANKLYDAVLKENDELWDKIPDSEFKLQKGKDYLRIDDEQIVPFTNYPKSAIGNNGMFDMTNPNIYKTLIPGAIATGLLSQEYQTGGEYKVKSGDTFYGIANRNNITWEDLRKANPGINIEKLKLNQTIKLPIQNNVNNIPTTPITNNKEKSKKPSLNLEGLKKGIAQAESLGGTLMINPESTATGLYGQRFSELKGTDLYKGTREEFAKDLEAQNKIFDIRLNKGINSTKGLIQDAKEVYDEYYPQIKDFEYSQEDLIALVNFLGRQGTREFLGYHIRDKKPLNEALPNIYGQGAGQSNKTPEEYLKIIREYYQEGGEQNQFQIYKDYVYGVYDGTEMAKAAEKVYDKLNRIYYKEAKASGLNIPNYIMSRVMKQADN